MEHNTREQWACISAVIRAQMQKQVPKRITQAQLAGAVGISRDALINYLSGKREMPFGVFMQIADVLDVTPQRILDDADELLGRGR